MVKNSLNYKMEKMKPVKWVDTSPKHMATVYQIVETKTGIALLTNLTKQKAQASLRHLNFGGGFDGYTPTFFLTGVRNYE